MKTPEAVYKAMYGREMPEAERQAVLQICGVLGVTANDPMILFLVANGWFTDQARTIPNAVLAKTKEAGAEIEAKIKATCNAAAGSMVEASNVLIKKTTEEAIKVTEIRFNNAREEFTHHATAEIKRIAAEAKNLAPSQYRIIANGLLGASILAALVLGYVVGGYRTKTAMIDDLRDNPAGYKEFSSDVRVNGQAMAGFKLTGQNRISFYPKKETPKEAEKVDAPKLPDK